MRFLILFFMLTNVVFAQSFYAIKEKTIEGREMKLEEFKGKVLLIVNLASQCGYTPQLESLESLHQKYKGKNFVLLGVPTNDFGGQTPEGDQDFKAFCSKNYNVTFPLLTKKTVSGDGKRELYKFLTETADKKHQGPVKWNFEKFLVDKTGKVVERFSSKIGPMDAVITEKIEALLK